MPPGMKWKGAEPPFAGCMDGGPFWGGYGEPYPGPGWEGGGSDGPGE
jgi:hypothetical protein